MCPPSHSTKLEKNVNAWKPCVNSPWNGTKFSRQRCGVFMNENEIKMKEITKGERFEEIQNFQLENDDVMQIVIIFLFKWKLKGRSHGKKFQLVHLLVSMMNH